MSAKYQVKRARISLRNLVSSLFRDINVVDAASYSFQEDTITKQSTNEVIGDVAKKVIKSSGTLTLTMGSTEWANFLVAVRAKASTQGAVTAGAFTLPIMAIGEQFKLPSVNVTDVAIGTKVEGVDYTVLRNAGLIVALKDFATATASCTYSAGLAKRGAIAAGAAAEYEVLVDDQLNGEVTQFYKWSPNLPTNIALISANEFGVFEVSGDLLLDTTKPSGGDLGQFAAKYEIAAAV